MRIPYARPSFTDEDLDAVREAMSKPQWVGGEQTKAFEQELAAYQQVKRAVFVNSGSSALLVASHIFAERGQGEVIVPAIQFPTLQNSLIHAGFQPVVVDVDDTLTMDPLEAVKAVNENTRGIAVVHVAGNVANLLELRALANEFGLWLLEDNCDGFGGEYLGQRVGSFGDISVTSFHIAHIISTGQGGGIFTEQDDIADAAISYRDWGRMVDFDDNSSGIPPLPTDHLQRYTYTRLGFNLAPLEMQAVLGRRQLRGVDRIVLAREKNHVRIAQAAWEAGFEMPQVLGGSIPAWFSVPMRTTKRTPARSEVFKLLKKADIEYRNILSGRIDLHPAYREYAVDQFGVLGDLPVADEWAKRGFWVSAHSSLTEEEVQYVCDFFKNTSKAG